MYFILTFLSFLGSYKDTINNSELEEGILLSNLKIMISALENELLRSYLSLALTETFHSTPTISSLPDLGL